MKKILYIFLLTIILFTFNNCGDADVPVIDNFVSFEADSYDFGVEIDGSSSNEIKLYATESSSSDRVFNIKINDESSTLDSNAVVFSQATIPANTKVGSFTVTIEDLNIGDLGESLVLEIENQEGLLHGEPITFNITRVCPFDPAILSFAFDSWPEEVSWEVKNSSDEVIIGVDSGTYAGLESTTQELCLPNGDYTITFADAYGDGIGAEGYTLSFKGQEFASGGAYGAGETISFSIQN